MVQKKGSKHKNYLVLVIVGVLAVSLPLILVSLQKPQSLRQYAQVAPVTVSMITNGETLLFSPAEIEVTVGTEATWINNSNFIHTTTSDVGNGGIWHSGNVNTGESFSFTFNQVGTFTYHCNIHSAMKGTVRVVAAAPVPIIPSTPMTVPSPVGIGTCPGGMLVCPSVNPILTQAPLPVTQAPLPSIESPVVTSVVPISSMPFSETGNQPLSGGLLGQFLELIKKLLELLLQLLGQNGADRSPGGDLQNDSEYKKCHNGIDDNKNGKMDCEDNVCNKYCSAEERKSVGK